MIVLVYSKDKIFHFRRNCPESGTEFVGKGFPIWVHKASPCASCVTEMVVYVSDNGEVYHLSGSCVHGHTLRRKKFGEVFRLKYPPCRSCANDLNLLNVWQISVESVM